LIFRFLRSRLLGAILIGGLLFVFGPDEASGAVPLRRGRPGLDQAPRPRRGERGDRKQKGKDQRDKKAAEDAKEEEGDDLFLQEVKENQEYLPDMYRCPECGYEQDETGNCPDHEGTPLVLVLTKGKNPLEPPDVDGNEDLIVDMPLTGLNIKKAAPGTASGTANVPGTPAGVPRGPGAGASPSGGQPPQGHQLPPPGFQ